MNTYHQVHLCLQLMIVLWGGESTAWSLFLMWATQTQQHVYPETPAHAHKLTITQHTCAVEEFVYSREEQISWGPQL